MKEELKKILDQEFQELDSEESSSDITVDELVSNQNKRREYLSFLEKLKSNGFSVYYTDDMPLEELEKIVKDISSKKEA